MKALAVSTEVKGEGMEDRFYLVTGEQKLGLLRFVGAEPAASFIAASLVPEDHHRPMRKRH